MNMEREAQLLRDAYAAGITQPRELANFMAQVGHESGGLRQLEESFRYTRSAEQVSGKVRSALREGREPLEAARLEALAGRPERLAELMYGGRMGNDDPGDGYRYRGRGYIQLTGKSQYADAGEALGLDLVRQPDLAAQPEHASRIATWYWQQNVPREVRNDARGAGAAINGRNPPNGLTDRAHRFELWVRELTPERVQALSTESSGDRSPNGGAPVTPDAFWSQTQPLRQGIADVSIAGGLLRQGDRGPEVRAVQQALAALGSTDAGNASLQADGLFGPRTADAVRTLQQEHGLPADGVVGPDTRELIARVTRASPLIESSEQATARPGTALDELLAAARAGDPAALKSALADFSQTAIGRSFHSAHAAHTIEVAQGATLAVPQPTEHDPR